ncbi:MAG: UDP-4-amino-4,6-dideoxy-N-acetyl-beta-L-altrosamine N-acetyltransferase [Deltaproteobacteria bacterium]|jgi:UDP-4-amino-4,6-dideoxy-N-acetyl-beta-L-altrosamine N-acetyltransferase|nr:UDP-4-amino-4,6-dideoxy-N-acetyl-beta-L-altrosamine N-acetyltransferase [Deltaproteobacteria bacterium]
MSQREDYRLMTMEEADLENVLKWRNSERIRVNMYTDHIIAIDEHRSWFERIKQDQSVIYKIFRFQDRPIGVVCFTDIDSRNNKCSWGFYLGVTDVPRRSGAAMEFLAIEHAFDEMNIRKLCCEIFAFNSNVIKLHKKFGFVEEGHFTKYILKNGKYEDVIFLASFKEQWLKLKDQLERLCFVKGTS